MLVILVLGRWRQDQKFKASPGYIKPCQTEKRREVRGQRQTHTDTEAVG